jgi:hypothetical protein
MDLIPKTFQDAVYIARKLNLEYLWIDALCILQHESANFDWVHEASLMRSVYGGAYVNLAASSATSVYSGCFLKPAYHSSGFCGRVTINTSEYSVVRNFHSSNVYEESSVETHLASRAWSLQEKLLPPRTLFFGDRGLFWECRTKIASEFLPDGFPGKLGWHLVQPEDKAWNWFDIVWHYSGAALTFGTDRLPALSGVATRQRETTGDDYLAGMWRRQLVMQIPWMVCSPQDRKKRPEWRAPSWSWASVDGRTTYWAYWNHESLVGGMKKYIYVLDAWTTPAGPDLCGAVLGGELSIGCSVLVRGRVQRQHQHPEEATSLGESETDRVLLEAGTRLVPVRMDCLDDEAFIRVDGLVYLLPVFSGESGLGATRSKLVDGSPWGQGVDEEEKMFMELMNRGLVLQRCGDRKGHFHRIGSFDLRHNQFPDEDPDAEKNQGYIELMAVLDKVGRTVAEAECAEVVSNSDHPEARYVITIE